MVEGDYILALLGTVALIVNGIVSTVAICNNEVCSCYTLTWALNFLFVATANVCAYVRLGFGGNEPKEVHYVEATAIVLSFCLSSGIAFGGMRSSVSLKLGKKQRKLNLKYIRVHFLSPERLASGFRLKDAEFNFLYEALKDADAPLIVTDYFRREANRSRATPYNYPDPEIAPQLSKLNKYILDC